jgi:hypothetical protein
MKHDTERVLSAIAIVVSLLCGAYIGHNNTIDHIQAQHDTPCSATVTRSCMSWTTYNGTTLQVWHDDQGREWFNGTQDKRA